MDNDTLILMDSEELPPLTQTLETAQPLPDAPPPCGAKHAAGAWWSMLLGIALPSAALAVIFGYLCAFVPGQEVMPMAVGLFAAMVGITLCAVVCAVWARVKNKGVANAVWIVTSALFCVWLMLAIRSYGYRIYATGVEWLLYVCILSMIPVFTSMIHVILWLTPEEKPHSIGKTLLPLLSAPLIWYLLVNVWRYASSGALTIIALLVGIVTTYGFLFILLRTLLLLAARKDSFWKGARIAILFVLPLLGLIVTQFGTDFDFFWNFSSPVYYGLVVANGVMMLLKEPEKPWQRLLLFFGRCITYLALTYFFVCLSPFYALSLLGLLVGGLGLLVLSPLLMWMYETRVLLHSAKELFRCCGGVKTVGAAVLGLLVIPVCLLACVRADKGNLSKAVTYLDGAVNIVGQDAGPVSMAALERTLDFSTNSSKLNDYGFEYYRYYDGWSRKRVPPPILSQAYKGAMGEHAPDYDTIRDLEKLYSLNDYGDYWPGYYDDYYDDDDYYEEEYTEVKLTGVQVDTKREGDCYRSYVRMTLTNDSDWNNEEYRTSFELPQGVFISGYYLDVLGERKSGLLTERSSALWMYNEVVSRALDPGILYYSGGKVNFRVFPFQEKEIRQTGIELLHMGPATLQLDGITVRLAPNAQDVAQPLESENGVIYLSAAAKANLPPATREPRYAFVVDCSENSDVEVLVERINTFCGTNNIKPEQATVTALNYRRAVWPMSQPDWRKSLLDFKREGGFGLGLTADAIFQEHTGPDTYPVMVVVTDDTYSTIMPADTAGLAVLSPETDGYYVLKEESPRLYPYDSRKSKQELEKLPDPPGMLRAMVDEKPVFLRDDGKPEILLREGEQFRTSRELSGTSWENALRLYGDSARIADYPEEEQGSAQIGLIKNSFRTGVMTPLTSYIVLETAEQEQRMLARQKKLLEGGDLDAYVDMNEDVSDDISDDVPNVVTSEPPIAVCLLLLALFIFVSCKREKGVELYEKK